MKKLVILLPLLTGCGYGFELALKPQPIQVVQGEGQSEETKMIFESTTSVIDAWNRLITKGNSAPQAPQTPLLREF